MAAAKYVQGTGEKDNADTLRMRAEASRRYIRNLHQYPVLSAQWLDLVDSLEQLSRMTELELAMPANAKVADTMGRDNESTGTLWDQEQHEDAIRILVEEAKVNLCLRMMDDYKRWHYSSLREDKERRLDRKCKQFEESLGHLLARSFLHLETLQLTDVRLLLEYCTLVMDKSIQLGIDAPANARGQETMVLFYWASVMRHAESLNNSELLAKMQETHLVSLITSFLTMHAGRYSVDVMFTAATGLSMLCGNEDFETDFDRFFDSHDHKLAFLALETSLVAPVLQEDPGRKRLLRPLLDFFKTLQRKM